MADDEPPPPPRETVPTHVPGLDAIPRGGLLRGGVYLVEGKPGDRTLRPATPVGTPVARRGVRLASAP